MWTLISVTTPKCSREKSCAAGGTALQLSTGPTWYDTLFGCCKDAAGVLNSPPLSVLLSAQVPSSPIRVPSTRLHQIKQVRKDGLIGRMCYTGNVHVIPTGSDGIQNMPARVAFCEDHSSSPFHSGSRASLAEILTHLKQ